MDAFSVSSFGRFVMHLFRPLFRATSWQSFFLLASGWALARERHTITSYLWLSGATDHKHFSRFYVFLGTALYRVRLQLWRRVMQCAAAWVPDHEPVEMLIDDFTKKKAGDHIDGLDCYRLRFVMAAARTLWFIERTAHMETLNLRRYRPWYRKKVALSQLDVLILREALHAQGVSPILRFDHPLDETCQLSENTQAHAA